uniref:Alternative protein GATM n=1 Tax=Homo sapiens TaxID=9606 RepID=L8E7A2_HUMAN|nr:alternative protein GATM [Homo sapiens]
MNCSALNNHLLNRGRKPGLLLLLFFDIKKITSARYYSLLLKLFTIWLQV